jgi:predicted naringenin-chalcone synthase
MGCHGAFNGMGVASAFAATRADARVLMCAVELSSLHLHYGHDRGRIIANALFADGASAYVIGPDDGTAGAWRIADTTSCMLPDCQDAMTWIIGDHGFEMGLSPAVPALIQLSLRPWLASWLAARGLTIESVRSWAIHPGGPQILDAMETVLGLDHDATAISRAVLAEHGNMSSATIGFILERMIALDCPRPCVALGFGPGLMAEGALLW